MPIHPIPPESTDPRAEAYRDALDVVIEMSVDMARILHQLAKTQAAAEPPGPVAELAGAFNDTARTVRRSILLAQRVQAEAPAQRRLAARKRIIRVVEDNLQRHATGEAAERLHAEFLDRLDAPDLVEEIDDRPVADIIADICRDLGLDVIPGAHPWKRRTPADIALLCARAAAPRQAGTAPAPAWQAVTDRMAPWPAPAPPDKPPKHARR